MITCSPAAFESHKLTIRLLISNMATLPKAPGSLAVFAHIAEADGAKPQHGFVPARPKRWESCTVCGHIASPALEAKIRRAS